MKLSKRQQALHWRLWGQAKAILFPELSTLNSQLETEARHALYIRALGEDKSLTAMDDDDFDLVLGALNAILEPDNLAAQLHALNGQKKRRLHRIRQLASPAYAAAIVAQMNAEGALKTSELDQMGVPELEKVIIALRKQDHRGEEKVKGRAVLQSVATMGSGLLSIYA